MREGYIAVLDSGVGGLSVLGEMIELMPNERYLYFGDNENAPYGNRTKMDLVSITLKNLDAIMRYKLKAIVVGCNTISTTILKLVADYSGVPTFGVFPPIEKAVKESNSVLLLSTVRTALEFKNTKNISILGLADLAKQIENNVGDLSKVDFAKSINNPNNVFFSNSHNKNSRYDTVILGCTHYFFVKNKILDHFRPQNLISGTPFTAGAVFRYLKSVKSIEKNNRFSIKFIGNSAYFNEQFFKKSGQDIKKN